MLVFLRESSVIRLSVYIYIYIYIYIYYVSMYVTMSISTGLYPNLDL